MSNEDDEEYQQQFDESQCIEDTPIMRVCDICQRKFHNERIAKHRDVCEKATKNQLEREKIIKKKQQQKAEQQQKLQQQENQVKNKTVNQWREQHKQFQEIIQYNKQVHEVQAQGGDTGTIKTPEIVVNSNYVYCEHCQRSFAPNVADTHIPKCKEIKHKPKPPKKPAKEELKRTTHLSTASTTLNGTRQLEETKKSFKPLMKTAELQKRQLPELKKAIYTGFGFMDCQTRATALSDTECPHCMRRFNNKAALRHIPICEKLTSKEQFKLKLKNRVPLQKKTDPILPAILLPQNHLAVSTFCTQCGNKMQAIHKYCGGCGHKKGIDQ